MKLFARLLSRGCYRDREVVIAKLLSRGCYREGCYREEVVIVRLLS